ncbi:MAG TPA: hypothetical protein PKM88_03765 [bacterium]|nr:hypothetical protein [bacterium]
MKNSGIASHRRTDALILRDCCHVSFCRQTTSARQHAVPAVPHSRVPLPDCFDRTYSWFPVFQLKTTIAAHQWWCGHCQTIPIHPANPSKCCRKVPVLEGEYDPEIGDLTEQQ